MTGPAVDPVLAIPEATARALCEGRCATPHDVLGVHAARLAGRDGVVVRALAPDANGVSLELDEPGSPPIALSPLAQPGLFACFVPDVDVSLRYRLRLEFAGGATSLRADAYTRWPTLGDHDLHLFNQGRHLRLWEVLGAHARVHDGEYGVAFAVWAPNAERVSVVGDFCHWDGRRFPMRVLGVSGIFELFIPGLEPGALYQYEVRSRSGEVFCKADPFAFWAELPPGRASRVAPADAFAWGDERWQREKVLRDPRREPMAVYELHAGSWRRDAGGGLLDYRALAHELVPHLLHFGFTHVELLPICEHPFDGSWGYQVTGFFAPTSRHGAPDDFRYFVDQCHQHGIGVILDWVPAHFPRDAFALARFDGTELYEHADPRRGEHPDWGTLIFNYGRHEVRNFLIASALYWLESFHVDGLRVDAVASMLYRDYSRNHGEWVPNQHGGREDEEAVAFLRELNRAVRERTPGCFTVAEESTAWPGVTQAPEHGGLGFTFKWNLGWMHDTLGYFAREPVHRSYHQNDLSFAMMYEYSEAFVMPLSHDEVVHGKGSLIGKLPGDDWQRFANLRALFAYQYTRPGKKLLFMGSELAPDGEWDHTRPLPWDRGLEPYRKGLSRFLSELGALYRAHPALFRSDGDPAGFQWIDAGDHAQSVLSYLRLDGADQLVVVCNLTPVPREGYRVGAPGPGRYRLVLDSDAERFGGSGYGAAPELVADATPMHDRQWSLSLTLPPLSVIVMAWSTPPPELELRAAAARAGIYDAYYEIGGQRHETSDATRRALLSASGRAHQSYDGELSPRAVQLPDVTVVRAGDAAARSLVVELAAPADELSYELAVEREGGAIARRSGAYLAAAGSVWLPLSGEDPPCGEFTVRGVLGLESEGGAVQHVEFTQHRLVAPRRAYSLDAALPAASGRPRRALGLWIQLYSLYSDSSWGIGDLGDLRRLLRWAGALGLDFVGLNPLHAPSLPAHPVSPYFPSSRLFDNWLHLDIEAIPEFAGTPEVQALVAGAEHRALRAQAASAACVDYRVAYALKRPVLRLLAHAFFEREQGSGSPRDLAYRQYLTRRGAVLDGFAAFCALEEHFAEQDFRRWPQAYRRHDSPELARFMIEHRAAVDEQRYIQFELDRQLAAAAEAAREAGMRIGLYLDLAVGNAHGGHDSWRWPELFPQAANLGAPPDDLAPDGQDWGIAPLAPLAFATHGYGYFGALCEHSMRHAGALRIDHVMGLSRQFWVPAGQDGPPGTYVRQPLEELLGICVHESQQARCVVVGEDLGTVPEGFREALAERGLLRYRVLPFELGTQGFAREGLATLTTHDMPPFVALWSGADIEQRVELGLLDDSAAEGERLRRTQLRRAWLARLDRAGTLDERGAEAKDPRRVLSASHALLAASGAGLSALSLGDLLGQERSFNLPGTTAEDGFESWTARLPVALERIVEDKGLAAEIAALLRVL